MEGIKMVSGQTPGPMQPGQYPMYQPVYQPPHRHPSDYLKPLVSDLVLAIAIVIGLFFVWLGSLIWGVSDPGESGRDWGLGVKSFGMLILTIGLFLGGLLRSDMEKWVRVALIAASVLLIMFVGFWSMALWGAS